MRSSLMSGGEGAAYGRLNSQLNLNADLEVDQASARKPRQASLAERAKVKGELEKWKQEKEK